MILKMLQADLADLAVVANPSQQILMRLLESIPIKSGVVQVGVRATFATVLFSALLRHFPRRLPPARNGSFPVSKRFESARFCFHTRESSALIRKPVQAIQKVQFELKQHSWDAAVGCSACIRSMVGLEPVTRKTNDS